MQVLIELFKFSFFGISGRGIDLDYRDIEWFALETDHSVIFEIAPKYCISDSFVDYEGYSISKGFFPTEVDIKVIWIKLDQIVPGLTNSPQWQSEPVDKNAQMAPAHTNGKVWTYLVLELVSFSQILVSILPRKRLSL